MKGDLGKIVFVILKITGNIRKIKLLYNKSQT